MIEKSMLQEMFDNIRHKASWSIDDPCVWGYFFVDRERSKLLAAAQELENLGYRFIELHDLGRGGLSDPPEALGRIRGRDPDPRGCSTRPLALATIRQALTKKSEKADPLPGPFSDYEVAGARDY
jgi:hypothetical protein